MFDLMTKAKLILESDTHFASTLAANIKACYSGLADLRDLEELKKEIAAGQHEISLARDEISTMRSQVDQSDSVSNSDNSLGNGMVVSLDAWRGRRDIP